MVSTSSKPDIFMLTSGLRERRGPVHVFNPQGIGGVPSTIRWSPVEGCTDVATATRRAEAFASAVQTGGTEDARFWDTTAAGCLRALFTAAALLGGDMRLVTRWAHGEGTSEAIRTLQLAGAQRAGGVAADPGRQGRADRRDDPRGAEPGADVHGRPAAGRVHAARRRRRVRHR